MADGVAKRVPRLEKEKRIAARSRGPAVAREDNGDLPTEPGQLRKSARVSAVESGGQTYWPQESGAFDETSGASRLRGQGDAVATRPQAFSCEGRESAIGEAGATG